MKKLFVFCLFFICLLGCSNSIKVDEQPKITINSYSNTKYKDIEFVGLKNSERFSNENGYSYFTEQIAFILEKQKLMLDKTGFIIDDISLESLKTYETNNRYIAFGEIKNYKALFLDKEQAIGAGTKTVVGLLTYGIGAGVLHAYTNSNKKTIAQCEVDMNFYIFDKKQNKIIKKIPISVIDQDLIAGSWNDTNTQYRNKIYGEYFIRIFNLIGDRLFIELS